MASLRNDEAAEHTRRAGNDTCRTTLVSVTWVDGKVLEWQDDVGKLTTQVHEDCSLGS
jgi:hypothetical protein